MKQISRFRDASLVKGVLNDIKQNITEQWVLMEICGGQTHAIMQFGFDQLLPEEIELVHGPGCPVCVTPLALIDKSVSIASLPNVIFTSYGDMLRVPGSDQDLFSVRAMGGDVRVVYSPLDAVHIAQENPEKEVVFFAIGFETTAPANAMSVIQAKDLRLNNYSVLVSHVRVPPAIEAILSSHNNRVQGFLAAGHVCTVMGYKEYIPIAEKFGVPIVVTGFEPVDIIQGISMTIRQLEQGSHQVENGYPRVVTQEGNLQAQSIINKVFKGCDRAWRGIGNIPNSGWCLRNEYSDFDAETRFPVDQIQPTESSICISGEILQGQRKPPDCPAFRKECNPSNPLGATMVSAEGTCAAYFHYGIQND